MMAGLRRFLMGVRLVLRRGKLVRIIVIGSRGYKVFAVSECVLG